MESSNDVNKVHFALLDRIIRGNNALKGVIIHNGEERRALQVELIRRDEEIRELRVQLALTNTHTSDESARLIKWLSEENKHLHSQLRTSRDLIDIKQAEIYGKDQELANITAELKRTAKQFENQRKLITGYLASVESIYSKNKRTRT